MLLPAGFKDSLEDSYYHLKEHVQIWDVAAERQVEISGDDSAKLVQLMTCEIYLNLKMVDAIIVPSLMIKED